MQDIEVMDKVKEIMEECRYLLVTKSGLDKFAEARFFDSYAEAARARSDFYMRCAEYDLLVIACVIFQVKR